jgi:hypothetical protein
VGAELPSPHDQRDLILDTAASHDAVLVEGAGGVAVNLGKAFGLLDIAGHVREAGLPVQWIIGPREPRHPQPQHPHRPGDPGPRVLRAGHRDRFLARRPRAGRAAQP